MAGRSEVAAPALHMEEVRKTLTAGHGACRVRVTVLGGVSLSLAAGQALALTGPLPMARSMLCAIAAGVARADAGAVRWGAAGLRAVRYAALGDAPRVLQRRDGSAGGLVVLDAALIEGAPPADLDATVALLRPWLADGGAALVSLARAGDRWPWAVRELVGGQLRDPRTVTVAAPARPLRAVAEGAREGTAMADPLAGQ